MAQSARAAQYTGCISSEEYHSPNVCPGYDTKPSDGEAPIMKNADPLSIAIAPRSTLAWSDNTW